MIPTVATIMRMRDTTTPDTAPPMSLLLSPSSSSMVGGGVGSDDGGDEGEGAAMVCVELGDVAVGSGGILGEAIIG